MTAGDNTERVPSYPNNIWSTKHTFKTSLFIRFFSYGEFESLSNI